MLKRFRWFMMGVMAALVAMTATRSNEPLEAQRAGMPKEFDYHYYMNEVDPKVGEPALPMHAKDPDGNEMDLKQFLGRYVLIEFGCYT